VRDLLKESGIPEREIAIVMVNGKRGQLDSALQHGDSVSLFPLIGGG
jgi:sulfur carrier protein ThiS